MMPKLYTCHDAGIRGGLFTVAMTRLNVRIRTSLFDALMRQEIAFFTSTKTGEPVCLRP